jgi:hypothetical protein
MTATIREVLAQVSTGETAAATIASTIGELAARPLRIMTLVSGTVIREPKAPGQGQAFANWGMSSLRYDVVIGRVDEYGNGEIPEGYGTRHAQLY